MAEEDIREVKTKIQTLLCLMWEKAHCRSTVSRLATMSNVNEGRPCASGNVVRSSMEKITDRRHTVSTLAQFSLLWPDGAQRPDSRELMPKFISDLGLRRVANQINITPKHLSHTEDILFGLSTDSVVINYRLDIMTDFINLPTLAKSFREILPHITKLSRYLKNKAEFGEHSFQQIAWKLDILEMYVYCIQCLYNVLNKLRNSLCSSGLKGLLSRLEDYMSEQEYQSLAKELPSLRASLTGVSSVTVGINFDDDLRPAEATILAVGSKPFKEKTFLARLLGLEEERTGITQFHSIARHPSAVEQIFFRDLNSLFTDILAHIEKTLTVYTTNCTHFLLSMEPALDFYLGATVLTKKMLDAGLPMCRPVIVEKERRFCCIDNMYDLNLALDQRERSLDLKDMVITNDVKFDADGRIFILTGPNQGGKTTYTRAIGIIQVLAQSGMYIPGSNAVISPVDYVLTHFLEEEKVNSKEGRLAEECRRFAELFKKASAYSLILMNESLSSTSPGESLYLTRDIVKAIRFLGARAVFATHLHDLAAEASAINEEVPGDSNVISMVAGLATGAIPGTPLAKRTYKVSPGPPLGVSLAKELAHHYNISFEQLTSYIGQTTQSVGRVPENGSVGA